MTRAINFRFSLLALCLAGTAVGFVSARTIQPVPDQFGDILTPQSVTSQSGAVTMAGHIVTLTKTAGGPDPVILLDYGRDVGGLPEFKLAAVAGRPQLRAIFSESRQMLLPSGDGASFIPNAPSDPGRVDVFFPDKPGLIVNPQIQGGERFERLSLTTPGSVTLSMVGIKSLTSDPTNTANTGHFTSSDPLLNQIWTLGARSLQICAIPTESLPALMRVNSDGADVATSPIIQYQFGSQWSDYTASFRVKIVANEAGFTVRGAYMVTFDAADDKLNAPNTVRVALNTFLGAQSVATAMSPAPLTAGSWHRIKIVARGKQVDVYVDDAKLVHFNAPADPTGSIGLQNASGAEAIFRDLRVQDPAGKTLYASSLTDPATLTQFAAATNTLPVILDGAKRDRVVWLGDLGQAAPTEYYSTGESKYVKGSLQLLGSFQNPEGEVSSNVTPLLQPGLRSDADLPAGAGFYSLPYSIYFVNVLHDYVLYTGDTAFAAREWPVVTKELAYLAQHTNDSGLLVTDGSNGMDWSLDDHVGEVSEYNTLYVAALHNAADLARELGQPGAANFTLQADRLTAQINKSLYNPTTGVYDVASTQRGTIAQDANAMAVLYGVAPAGKALGVLRKTDDALMTPNGPVAFSDGKGLTLLISPFMAGYEADAYFAADDSAGALKIIRLVWGKMVPGTAFYTGAAQEALATDGITPQLPSRTISHGWSSGATSALSAYVLGVRPLKPGYAAWIMQPQLGDLTWVKGDVPTPHGPIHAAWKRNGLTLTVDVDAPYGEGTISLPAATLRDVTLNGRKLNATARLMPGRINISAVTPGHYHITAIMRPD